MQLLARARQPLVNMVRDSIPEICYSLLDHPTYMLLCVDRTRRSRECFPRSGDSSVRLWDLTMSRMIAWLPLDDYPVYDCTFSPDSESLLVCTQRLSHVSSSY